MPRRHNNGPDNNSPAHSPEEALFFAVIRSLSTGNTVPPFQDLPVDFDWDAFYALVNFHRIGPLIHGALKTHWGDKTQPETSARLNNKGQQIRQSLSQKAVMSQIHDALEGASIQYLLMKGAAISERYYPVPSRRIAIDIDILTAKQDFKASCDTLKANGFIQTTPDFDVPDNLTSITHMLHADYTFWHPGLKVTVELHHRFAKNPYLFPVPFERALLGSELLTVNTRAMPVLGAPLQFIYGCTHGAKHDWFRLKWLCDIDFMIVAMSPSDWAAIWTISDDLKLTKIVRETLSLHTAVFGAQSRYKVSWPELSSVQFYQETMRRMKLTKDTQISDMDYHCRQMLNNFSRVPNGRYGFYGLFLICVDFEDVKRLRLSKTWWPVYIITGIVKRICRVIGRGAQAVAQAITGRPH